MNLPANIQQLQTVIEEQKQHFEMVVADEQIKFAKEADFALQHLRNNSYLAGVAQRNPDSLRDAVKNLAQIGISLNPAEKHAYLVPRNNQVCLDIGYLGLIHLATESGAIEWVQAKHVYSNDTYESNGVDKAPTHTYSPFGNRGNVVGVYCVAKTATGAYLTTEMPIAEVEAIKKRSAAANKGFSPWKSDEGQMQLKTVIKRAYKQWPKSERLSRAIHYLDNQGGQGIDFAEQKRTERREHGDLNPTPEQKREIENLFDDTATEPSVFLGFLANNVLKREVQSIDELTSREADQAIGFLKQKLNAMGGSNE